MILYNVRYRRRNRFWKTIKNVRGDTYNPDANQMCVLFIRADNSMVSIPAIDTVFEFPKERFFSTKEKKEEEIKAPIPTT